MRATGCPSPPTSPARPSSASATASAPARSATGRRAGRHHAGGQPWAGAEVEMDVRRRQTWPGVALRPLAVPVEDEPGRPAWRGLAPEPRVVVLVRGQLAAGQEAGRAGAHGAVADGQPAPTHAHRDRPEY